ncbi:hypothetical protein O59_001731 [Cellvibrio sp. BR]|jgi:hypothetical protein|uniref:hypothetical protein n=1 Tax=unclassified Cellvibrio TaxID=2624793 RepID=UPI0002600CE8|nr:MULTISPECIES: hypothetical protein [unclassified Cellvibrio]EIK45057.1 hypothetical protein O59_001731 [Cellvibrio sp. BR]QEY13137.1 hypothetical protein D0B88_13270 [Cellvibrio sp. KY-YJ-3]UUA73593.1 transposase [Cellvibrio sp. QJXJ]
MKLGTCPCCGSRDLQKVQGEEFVCQACKAPLRFTWSAAHGIGIVLPLTLPNLMQQFPEFIRYGVPAVLLAVLLVLYFKYRRFHLDEIRLNELLLELQHDLQLAGKFSARKTGVLDFIQQMNGLKNTYGKVPAIQTLLREHFNRVGGFNIEEQSRAFSGLYPDIDLNQFSQQQISFAQAEIERLRAYSVKA